MKKKILMTLSIITCAVALVISSVVGTVAFLRAQAKITNTFTYGDVAITLDETVVDVNGTPIKDASENLQRDSRGNTYRLVADTKYTKDPIIHIAKDSVPMYLFVKIDNGILGLGVGDDPATRPDGIKTIHEQMLENGWKVYNDGVNTYQRINVINADAGITITQSTTVYYLSIGAAADATDAKIVDYSTTPDINTFSYFHTGGSNVTKATMTAYFNHNAEIVVSAFAVQASGMTLNEAANVFKSEHFISAIPTP